MEIIGYTGLTILLVGHLLSTRRVTTKEGWGYSTINLIGSTLLVVVSLNNIAVLWQFAVLNGMWAALSGYNLMRYLLNRREELMSRAERRRRSKARNVQERHREGKK